MYQPLEQAIREAIRFHIAMQYHLDVSVITERPPRIEMGELATPVCFDLAKRLKRPPRLLAQEMAVALGPVLAKITGVARIDVAGGGYLNVFLDRASFFRAAVAGDAVMRGDGRNQAEKTDAGAAKIIVEHTCINPNKAAHIGHLRNAVLGDTFARLLRHAGERVEVQNYIDNTGVQVADVVLGFLHIEKKSLEEIARLIAGPRFDYYCWDLYARVTQFLEEDRTRLAMRAQILKDIEAGAAPAAHIAEMVSTAVVRCHLKTLDRLGIEYDLLPRESEILHLKFWDAAFELLKDRGAIQFVSAGKNAGCWVMPLSAGDDGAESVMSPAIAESEAAQSAADASAKIIVRSDGTVTYVGKDIAYHLWKFGLLNRDFFYRHFHVHPGGHMDWITSDSASDAGAPEFGHGDRVYNVIDSRQTYPQAVVNAGLRALGFTYQADRLTHLAYDVVALTPRCAVEMGYEIAPEDAARPFIEVSGRKGQGVKADELLDQLESLARAEVDSRHPEASAPERAQVAHAIAIGALRYFLLRYTRTTIIAFDFRDALSFEGETGPYVQYAAVRARSIFRKLEENEPGVDVTKLAAEISDEAMAKILAPPDGNDLWSLALLASSLSVHAGAALKAQEPAFAAKYAFQLAQAFNLFYHRHRILSEEDPQRRTFLLLLTKMALRQLTTVLQLLGMESPEMM